MEAWLVSPGSDSVSWCSMCIISFHLPSMMSFIDSLSTATELSTLKTWVVRTALVYNGTDDGTRAKHVVTKDMWPPVLVALSLPASRKVWQPETHLLNWGVFFPRTVYRVALKSRAQCSSVLCWTSGCALSVQLSFMMSFYNPLFTASEPSTLKTWSVRSAKESACKVTDVGTCAKRVVTRGDAKVDNTVQQSREHSAARYCVGLRVGTCAKRVVTRGDAKVDNTVQPVIGNGLHSSRSNSEQSVNPWTFQFLRLWRSS